MLGAHLTRVAGVGHRSAKRDFERFFCHFGGITAGLELRVVSPDGLRREFQAEFAREARVFSAPGRVNLIGEHTDYNDGFVLPVAIERRTFVAAAARSDRVLRVRSREQAETSEIMLDAAPRKMGGTWLDYVEGTARSLAERGVGITGADLLIASSVPLGAGLSASASLEVSVGYALAALVGPLPPDRVTLALAGQAAEHEYVGTLCGIMDQYIAALGKRGQALLIDCRSLETSLVPLTLGAARLMVCDSQVKHSLASSAYNQRRAECAEGVRLLAERLPGIRALRDVTSADLERHGSALPPLLARRCRHVVGENERVQAAAAALGRGDLAAMGRLMVESHRSLQFDYEVSCPELDFLVDCALELPGVYGSRMTGGGFGGCTIALIEGSAVEHATALICSRFRERFGGEPKVFATDAADGVREE
jgi:galactokinase